MEDLFVEEREPMLKVAVLIVGRREVAEEVVQDAFAAVSARWAELENPGGYLRGCVVNGARMALRRREVEHRHLIASGQRHVGVATVSLPPDATQVAANAHSSEGVGHLDAATLHVALQGRACTIASTYVGMDEEPGLAVTEEIEAPNGEVSWSRNRAGTRWQVAVDRSDVVEVTCDDPTPARVLVERITL